MNLIKFFSSISNLNYRKRIELGFIFSLILIILIFLFSKHYKVVPPTNTRMAIISDFVVEDIPVTRQGIPRQRPQRPEIIIPVEDEVIPEDEVIEDFDFSVFEGKDGPPGLPGGEGFIVEVLPRPIAEVFPEYPKEDLKNKIEGVVTLRLFIDNRGFVKDVIVMENTTGSQRCARAAKEAAYKNRFIPARSNNNNVPIWISKRYTFSAPK